MCSSIIFNVMHGFHDENVIFVMFNYLLLVA